MRARHWAQSSWRRGVICDDPQEREKKIVPFPKPMFQMKDREVIRHLAELAESFEDEIPGAKRIADAIREHAPRSHGRLKGVLYDLHCRHPDWTAKQLAEKAGCDFNYVYTVAKRGGWQPRPAS